MTELNNEIRELTVDELEQVSGGSIMDRIVDAYLAAVGKNLMDAIHPPKPGMSLHMR
ncbi:MAG: bacteriocin [Rhizobiales bacterium]|nr:bacteriocin [Hyphomicrobiales bacterium]